MEIAQRFTVPYPRDAVWACFHDTAAIVACLPGAALTAEPLDGQLKLAMTIKLGPIVATFAGDGLMALDEAAYRGSVSGTGIDRKSASRVKGEAAFALDASVPGETSIDVKVDYAIAGALAQFSRGGIVIELATRLTEAFAGNLKMRLDEQASLTQATSAPELAPEPAPAASSPRPAVPPPVAPLNLGNLFWKVLWDRVRNLFGFGRKTS
jgi:carbon monoxide dehydrogenase subunit G